MGKNFQLCHGKLYCPLKDTTKRNKMTLSSGPKESDLGSPVSTYGLKGRTRATTSVPPGISLAWIWPRSVRGVSQRSSRLRQVTTSYCSSPTSCAHSQASSTLGHGSKDYTLSSRGTNSISYLSLVSKTHSSLLSSPSDSWSLFILLTQTRILGTPLRS